MQNLVEIPLGLPGKVYRSPMPYAAFDLGHTTFDEFQQEGIDTVVILTVPGEDYQRARLDLIELYREQGWQVIHFPIEDFHIPLDKAGLHHTLEEVIAQARAGKKVVVHCYAGRGRTGLFLALVARRVLGMEGEEAITWLRQYFPAVETSAQAQVVIDEVIDGSNGNF